MPFHRRMSRIPLRDIRMTDGFWAPAQKLVREVTLEAEWRQIEGTGRLQNFLNASGAGREERPAEAALCDQTIGVAAAEGAGFTGRYFNDSDVYKWCEAVAYALAPGPNSKLQQMLDVAIRAIEQAQEPTGYLNTFFQLRHPQLKWRNTVSMHEMYCGGHLIEAGVALFESTGDRRLLDVATRWADHLMSVFGPDRRLGYPGHEEVELALLRLAKATGEAKYREMARWLVESRGRRPSPFQEEYQDSEAMTVSPWAERLMGPEGEYAQDHLPIREHTEIVGHAVRAMYLYIAATELAEGDEELARAMERIWDNLTRKRMYVTGGIGPSGENEGFTADYDLPNLSAYAETCASVGLVLWGEKLLHMTGASDYADVIERALYNGAMAGISASGDLFSYTNPLESRGRDKRVPWFDCACCPPNIARLIGSVAWHVAAVSDGAFWIHFPAGFGAQVVLNGVRVRVELESDYPWSGVATIRVEPERPVQFELRVRIPDWADEVHTELPGLQQEADWEAGYAVFRKEFRPGDALRIDFGMAPQWIEAHPRVMDDLGKVALLRGPIVYCAEEAELGFAPQLFSPDCEAQVAPEGQDLRVEGYRELDEFPDALYAPLGSVGAVPAEARFIPYHRWGNRGPTMMQVWFRRA